MRQLQLHHAILGTLAAWRHSPLDVLLRRFDRAALAMQAVLRVDLQFGLIVGVHHELVDLGRAETLLGARILCVSNKKFHSLNIRIVAAQKSGLTLE